MLPAAMLAGACLLAGCIGPLNIGAVRADVSDVMVGTYDMRNTDDGLAYSLEISLGTDKDDAFGPMYFGFAYSHAALELPGFDDTLVHRAGARWRSSVLRENTSSYPYAVVGVYGTFVEPGNERGGRLGIGVEGGYGVRLGLGRSRQFGRREGPVSRFALDLEAAFGYTWFEGRFEDLSTRLGAGVVVRW